MAGVVAALPEAIVGGFHVGEEALKRRARELKEVDDDIGAYMEALDRARAELDDATFDVTNGGSTTTTGPT